jgi:hypothetical protein
MNLSGCFTAITTPFNGRSVDEKALAAQDAAAGTGLSFLAEIMSGGDIYGDLEAARAELAEVNDIIRARGAASRRNYVRANASVYVGAV